MKVLPRDQYGIIPGIIFNSWTIVWAWPRGGMAWFMWNWGGFYRIGPITIALRPRTPN